MHLPAQRPILTRNAGFTLIELLVVIVLIAVLAVAIILAINPNKYFERARNSKRRQDIDAIAKAVYAYSLGENTDLPSTIPQTAACDSPLTNEICRTDAASCTGLVNLSQVTAGQKYLVEIPKDPISSSTNGTGYYISKNANSRITICAPLAEDGQTISATR